jgi:hypothetical protein
MNYANLFSRAWELIWRNKFLLALGFLAALSGDALSQVRIGPELSLLGDGGLLRANVLDVDGWTRALRLLGGNLVAATIITVVAGLIMMVAVLSGRAALIVSTRALDHREIIDLLEALRRGVRLIAPILVATLLLYIPFLIASEIVGELLRWSPGIIRLPIYILVLALLVVQIGLSLMHPLAICGIVIHRLDPIAGIEQSWRLIREHPEEMLVIAAALGALGLVFGALAYLVSSPVAGVSLLSILLAGPLNSFANLGLTLSFTALTIISVAILAPARAYQLVALTLAYQEWTDEGSKALEPGR